MLFYCHQKKKLDLDLDFLTMEVAWIQRSTFYVDPYLPEKLTIIDSDFLYLFFEDKKNSCIFSHESRWILFMTRVVLNAMFSDVLFSTNLGREICCCEVEESNCQEPIIFSLIFFNSVCVM